MRKIIMLLFIMLMFISSCGPKDKAVVGQDTAAGSEPSASVASVVQAEAANTSSEADVMHSAKGELEPSRIDSVDFESKVLGINMRMKVYLPKGYSENKKFPVLYLFHGMRDDENTIFLFSTAADRLMDEGKIEPLVIAAPYIVNSFGSNTGKEMSLYEVPQMGISLDTGMYEDYITRDAIKYVKENYSVIPTKDGQYAGGISMGGYAALHLAFKYPDSFSKVGGHSAALWFEGGPRDWLYPDEKEMQENDPVYLAQHSDLKGLQVYLDCGDEDDYGFQNSLQPFYELLKKNNPDAQFHLNKGGHNMGYWGEHVDEYLMFYSPARQ